MYGDKNKCKRIDYSKVRAKLKEVTRDKVIGNPHRNEEAN
jgi:hypothetical protein